MKKIGADEEIMVECTYPMQAKDLNPEYELSGRVFDLKDAGDRFYLQEAMDGRNQKSIYANQKVGRFWRRRRILRHEV